MTSLWRAVAVFVMLAAVMTLIQAVLAAMQERSPREEERSVSSDASEAETASQREAA